jgi:hypothetical protein
VTKETTGYPRFIHPTFLLDSQHSQSDDDVQSVATSKVPWQQIGIIISRPFSSDYDVVEALCRFRNS